MLARINITLFLFHVPFPHAFNEVPRSPSSEMSLEIVTSILEPILNKWQYIPTPSDCSCFSTPALGCVPTRKQSWLKELLQKPQSRDSAQTHCSSSDFV